MQSLQRIPVDDRRAQQLLVLCVGGDYFVVPSPELFSRHTGACRVLGDKNQRGMDYQLQVRSVWSRSSLPRPLWASMPSVAFGSWGGEG